MQIAANAVRILHHVSVSVESNAIASEIGSGSAEGRDPVMERLVLAFSERLRSNENEAMTAQEEALQQHATFTCDGELDSEQLWWLDGILQDNESLEAEGPRVGDDMDNDGAATTMGEASGE